jgi:predicted ATPase
VCTEALRVYLGYPHSPLLAEEPERIKTEAIFEKQVFFIRNRGFVTPTEARRITFEETVRFETIQEETYRKFGFELVSVEQVSLEDRVRLIKKLIR